MSVITSIMKINNPHNLIETKITTDGKVLKRQWTTDSFENKKLKIVFYFGLIIGACACFTLSILTQIIINL